MSESMGQVPIQFDDLEQQRETDTLGMWIFLATELMFFGGLFLVYAVYRVANAGAFAAASGDMNLLAGSVNTAILLTSSLTVALADLAIQGGRRRAARRLLWLTLLLGLAFLGIKGYEYAMEYSHGLVPFLNAVFQWEQANPDGARLFFNLYFTMTGLHALHLFIGCALLAVLAVLLGRGGDPARRQAQVMSAALYWHFVDVVWVFLFPLLYLAR